MSETAHPPPQGASRRHPYRRPKDAATLILIDRSAATPKVLIGRRHDKVVFMPGKFVFPGGSVDKTDNKVPVAAPIPKELEANLLKGSPKTASSRARSLAVAASSRLGARPSLAADTRWLRRLSRRLLEH